MSGKPESLPSSSRSPLGSRRAPEVAGLDQERAKPGDTSSPASLSLAELMNSVTSQLGASNADVDAGPFEIC